MFQFLQLIIHTHGGLIKGKSNQVTEREVDQLREGIKQLIHDDLTFLELDTDDGWVVVPGSQIYYIEAKIN